MSSQSVTSTPPSGAPDPVVRAPRPWRWTWVYDMRTDLLLTWCWVPFFIAAQLLWTATAGGPDAGRLVGELFAVVLLISLVHQPLTLLLVYGDRRQRATRRIFFAIAPFAVIALVGAAVWLDLWIVIPIAALWNAMHTLQQRYGLLRIHARKSGYGTIAWDRAIVYVPFVTVLAVVALLPITADQLDRFSSIFGARNSSGAQLLLDARPLILVLIGPLVIASLVVLVGYLRQERRAVENGQGDAAKWIYLLGSLALIASMLINPIAGLIAYIAAHALEYMIIVSRTLQSRYGKLPDRESVLSVAASTRTRRTLLMLGFLALLVIVAVWSRATVDPRVYLTAIYTIGVLHFTYDALIWKVRRPAIADNFGIART